ncbi:unnamed protein product [Malus baccata var. baccata]
MRRSELSKSTYELCVNSLEFRKPNFPGFLVLFRIVKRHRDNGENSFPLVDSVVARPELLYVSAELINRQVTAQTNISTDQAALLAFKAHITNDPRNILTTNWSTTNSNICNWVGITCGVSHLRVTTLNLSYMGLRGSIPHHLGNLSFLVQLEFRNNSFHGFIPNAIFNLSALQVLDLRNNQLSGSIPRDVGKLKMLKEISLVDNDFTGSIPREIGNLTMLKNIYLDFNMFEEIPYLIGSKDQVEKLYVQANALKGPVPLAVFNMSSLKILALTANYLTGSIPDDLCQHLPSIQILSLARNKLDGPLPSKLWQCKELLQFSLDYNNFGGSIPKSIGNSTQLERIGISYNNLTGGNQLTGAFPNFMSNGSKLTSLDMSKNSFYGFIPTKLCLLKTLEYLSLGTNNLAIDTSTPEVNILSCFANLTNLRGFHLSNNPLNTTLPVSFGSISTLLEHLDISNCNLRGNIPSDIGNLSNLRVLDLGDNEFGGSISTSVGRLGKLQGLYLNDNKLQGYIPYELCQLDNVAELLLGGNQLSGSIPSCLGNLAKRFRVLSLQSNFLSSTIPSTLWELTDILYLNLSFNSLFGPLSEDIGKLKVVTIVDLSTTIYLMQGEIPTGGPFQNFSAQSFVSNALLCGVPRLQVPLCKSRTDLKPHSKKAGTSILKYIIPGFVSAIILVAIALMLIRLRKKNVQVVTSTTWSPEFFWRSISRLELVRATMDFMKATYLALGVLVRYMEVEGAFKSFERECEMLSNIRHRNLIKIISCCSQIDFKAMILNYMPNGSLEKWLYSQNSSLNILQRLNIMIDVALALEYLHHGYSIPVVHCDVKPSNILLDEGMVAHVADFGIAKLGGGDYVTHTMTLATIGYMAPEYGTEGIVSTRGDVYSFGIVLMETFTKRKPTDEMFVDEMSLKQWVSNSLLSDSLSTVVDANLLGMHQEDHDL